jgi:PAS domain S-box-containing protein
MRSMDDRHNANRAPAQPAELARDGEMEARIYAFDWARTPLGPIAAWPQSLRTALSICLHSHFPILLWWGPELVMLYNDAYRPILGATKHPAAVGLRGQDCWPEVWQIIGPMLHGVLARGAATWLHDQLLLLDRNGYLEECYFTFSYSPISDEAGRVGGVFTAVTETTERVLSERRLRALRDLADRAVEARSDADVCRAAAATLAGNPADLPFALIYLRDAGARRAQLLGCSGLAPALAPGLAAVPLEGPADVWSLGSAAAGPLVLRDLPARLDGLAPPGLLRGADTAVVLPIPASGQEQSAGWLVAGVSPHRALDTAYRDFLTLVAGQIATSLAGARAYEVERRRAEALAELDRAKTTFFSNVSHEFRTPLSLMLGPLEELLRDSEAPLPPAQRQRIEVVQRNSLRLLKLVNTMLDFARIEAGRMEAVYAPTDLAALTADLAGVFRAAIERAGLRLAVDCPPLPEPVYVDRGMWEQIVFNLLSNAFKFTFEGAISVSMRLAGDQAELAVGDTGIGIPAGDIPHLFERFHRVAGASGRSYEGTGIGLALVQELVRLHGGSVSVASAVGRGSSFTVAIPLGTAHLPAERIGSPRGADPATARGAAFVEELLHWLPDDAAAAPETAAGGGAETPAAPRRQPDGGAGRPRILLADDSADIRAYVRRLLSDHYTVETAADGAAALEAARANPPDLVLADVMMPQLDGFALLRALREDPRTRDLPVILLSARAGEEARAEGMDGGADDYLVKPFHARELLARVGARIELARLRRESTEALRQSDARLRLALQMARLVVWEWDVADNRIVTTDTFAEIYGLPAHQLLERWPQLVHPDDLAERRERVRRAVAEGGFYHAEFRIRRPASGELAWIEERGFAVADAAGATRTLMGVAMDITERKQVEARDRFLFQTLAATRALSDPDEIALTFARLLGAFLGADRCAYTAVEDDGDHFTVTGDYTTPGTASIVGRFGIDDFGAEALDLMRTGQPFVVADVAADPRVKDPAAYTAAQIRALVSVPLCKNGRLVAGMAVHQRSPRRWDSETVALVQRVANLCWESIERARLEGRLRQRDAQLRQLAASVPQLIWTALPAGDLDFLSEQWHTYTGVDPRELLGWGWQRITHPDDLPHSLARWNQHLRLGEPIELKHRFRHRSGVWRWQLVRGLPFKDEQGQIVKWFGTCTDIHDQEVAAHDAQFLAELAEHIRVADDAQTLLADAVRRLGEYLDVPQCYVAAVDEAADLISVVAEYHAAEPFVAGPYRISSYPSEAVAALRGGQTVRVEDTDTVQRSEGRLAATHAPAGVRAYVLVPALRDGRWVSSLVVATGAPRAWQGREARLLESVGERLWLAGEKLRLDSALRASQADLALALQAGQAGTFTWDIRRDLNVWSPELEALYGLPAGAFGGSYQGWAALVVPEDRLVVERGLAAALRARREEYAYEFRAVLPGGARRWFAGRARFDYDAAGEPLLMRGINIDIHDRKQAELNAQFLLDLDTQINRLASPDAIEQAVIDRLGPALELSRCYFGHIDGDDVTVRYEWRRDQHTALGRYQLYDYFPPETLEQLRANIATVVADVAADPRTAAKAARHRALGIGAFITTPVLHQGRWVGTLNIVSPAARAWRADEQQLLRDVAARVWPLLEQAQAVQALRASEEQLQALYAQEQAARAEAEAASRLKDEFLATVSHELRTPLTTILGYGQLLQSRKRHEPDTLRAVSQIVRSAVVQAQLIEDLLDVSRIVTGKLRLERRLLDLAPIVAAAIETVRPALEAKGVHLTTALDAGVPLTNGDPNRLQQVVWNLLANAVKFTPGGGAVAVRLEQSGGSAVISVSDTGQGIRPDFLPHVFERFRQADGTSTRTHDGLGLGLAIVRHLVELHGGTVTAESPGEGLGATFTVCLPLSAASAEGVPSGQPGASDLGWACPPELDGLRVLLVDDQPEILQMLQEVLETCAAVVRSASSTAAALALLDTWLPDLIVSDIAMPGGDGYALIRALRARPPERGGAIPAVALTAYVRVEDRAQVLASGFQMYVPKPVEPTELLAVIGDLVRSGRD